MNLLFFLIILISGGIIFVLYHLFFSEERKGQAKPQGLEQPLSQKEEKINNFTKTISSLQNQIQDLTAEKILSEAKNKALQNQINALQSQIQNKDQELRQAIDKLKFNAEKTNKIENALNEEKESFLKEQSFLEDKIQNNEAEIGCIKEELKAKNQKIQNYEAQINELSKPPQDESAVEELTKKIEQYEARIKEANDKNRSLEEQLKAKQEQKEAGDEGGEMKDEGEDAGSLILDAGGKQGEERGEGEKKEERGIQQKEKEPLEIKGEISDRQKEILEYLKNNNKITRKEYMDKFSISKATAARDLKELQDRNMIRLSDHEGQTRYFSLA
ncbi:MAG: DeoR family transcriptional regulator [Candidatus Omnitrophota bacterium]